MIPFVDVLKKLRPDSSISFGPGTGLASVIWDNVPQGFVPPTQAEVDAAMAVIEYQEKRRSEYPPLTDLAEAIVKQPTDGGAALGAYRAACLAVQANYPKPE